MPETEDIEYFEQVDYASMTLEELEEKRQFYLAQLRYFINMVGGYTEELALVTEQLSKNATKEY